MLIDSNAYIGNWPFKQLKYNNCAGLVERMDKFGVSAAVVSNLNGIFYKNTQRANEELHQQIQSSRKFHKRFIPFAVINPIYNGWKDDFEISVSKLGMKGIRLHPAYHGYNLSNPACIELVKMARDRGLPTALSLRMVDSRPSSWMDIKDEWRLKDIIPIIKAVPDAKFMILNVANSTALNEEETQLLKNTDAIIDTSGRNIMDLGGLISTYGKEKFAFGSHSPILDYFTGLLRIESLRAEEADEATKELIRSGNLQRMLGL
jgi:predicted TIM-barrel fold metal-dependent hydrolase